MNKVEPGMKFRHKVGSRAGEVFQAKKTNSDWLCVEDSAACYGHSFWDPNMYEPITTEPRVPKVGETWRSKKPGGWCGVVSAHDVASMVRNLAVRLEEYEYVSGPSDAPKPSLCKGNCGMPAIISGYCSCRCPAMHPPYNRSVPVFKVEAPAATYKMSLPLAGPNATAGDFAGKMNRMPTPSHVCRLGTACIMCDARPKAEPYRDSLAWDWDLPDAQEEWRR